MKKTLLFLMAAVYAISMSAQNHIMRVWRGGEKLFETKIEENDSITFQQLKGYNDSDLSPEKATFTYENWRNVDNIYIYEFTHLSGEWYPVALPWGDPAPTAIPTEYRKPNKEFYIDENDTVPRWELAFNLCYNRNNPGVHMFGLWDKKSSIMRIYAFVEGEQNVARYCYYQVVSDIPCLYNNDKKMWQPSAFLFKNGIGFNMSALPDSVAPNGSVCRVLPITGKLTNGQFNGASWICFELKFNVGDFDIALDKDITIAMTAIQKYSLSASGTIEGWMKSQNGNITIEGNENRMISGFLNAGGSLLSSIASAISQGIDAEQGAGPGGAALVGGLGVIGAGCSAAGNFMNAQEEGEDSRYKLGIDFHVFDEFRFNGQLSSESGGGEGTSVTMSYRSFFENILNNRPKQQSSRRNGDEIKTISIGAWNLKQQPVLYVCRDASFATPYGSEAALHDNVLASFLDPTSIELMLNSQNILFEKNNIKKISLLAYDFAFIDPLYKMPAQPYYNFYNIPLEQIDYEGTHHWLLPFGEDGYKRFLLDTDAEYKTLGGNSSFQYTGVSAQFASKNDTETYSLNRYNQIYSPAICPPQRFLCPTLNLNTIGVSVILEIEFKDGDKRIFAERFLPEIRSFSIYDAPDLVQRLQNASVQTIDSIEMEMPLFEKQIDKACRVLEPLTEAISGPYPFVFIESVPRHYMNCNTINYDYGYGLRVRDYKDENTPGIVIRTCQNNTFNQAPTYSWTTLKALHDDLNSLNDWDTINGKLEQFGMFSLNNPYHYNGMGDWDFNIQDGYSAGEKGIYYIEIYHEDADGKLTLVTE